MSYYTMCSKKVACPHWNIEVILQGKYVYKDDSENAYLQSVTCNIIENSKLPLYEQDPKLKAMYCPNHDCGCEALSSFKANVNISKDGYSQ